MANQEVWEFPFRWAQILRSDLDDSQKIAVLEERDRSVEEVVNGIICCGRLEFTYRWAQIFPLITSDDPYDRTMGYELLEENDRVLEDTLNNCSGDVEPPDTFGGYMAYVYEFSGLSSDQQSTGGFPGITLSTFRIIVWSGIPANAELTLNIYDSGLSIISSTTITPGDFALNGTFGYGEASVPISGGPITLDGDEYVEFTATDGLGGLFGHESTWWAHRSGADFNEDFFQEIFWMQV